MRVFRRSTVAWFCGVYMLLTLGLTAVSVQGLDLQENRLAWIAAWVLVCNATAGAAFGVDKWLAQVGDWRVPEKTLWFAALVGGSFGATLGMWLFRHKTLRPSFRRGLPTLALAHAVAAVAIGVAVRR